ncbi:BlaR1 family beta-lactam sensor/signal transducer [Anaerostipes faecalis]|uniref:BlaR1 family beta-lactam sensor/signal transducer n=2 Tax=Anaerostipes TaxID=207244 RepID=UPI001C1DD302
MIDFIVHFFICNIFISVIIGFFLICRKLFKNHLTSRMQYNLWFLLLALLAVPFLPLRSLDFSRMLSWIINLKTFSVSNSDFIKEKAIDSTNPAGLSNWMNDFAISVHSKSPSTIGIILWIIWISGILVMITLMVKSFLHLQTLKKSALPLQNINIRKLYHDCMEEMKITREIPVYSTAFLMSPVFSGLFKPCIYLPIHLISDSTLSDIRYILLHELQHYKHKDTFSNYLMNLIGILYWFHPLVWYALREMRNDREIACDTSVLQMLEETSYINYGNTLLNFAEKISLVPFPFSSSLGGNTKQIKRRIINIASYKKPTLLKNVKSILIFMLILFLLLGISPILSISATDKDHYHWKSSSENISYRNLSAFFGKYEGSFVLYNLKKDRWNIYDMEHATKRVAPDSTYKIYDALFGLEENIITPEDSFIVWDKKTYPFASWNADQNLQSAMRFSVNWYFQSIDQQLGAHTVNDYFHKIKYGNENSSGNLSTYWMESSLKISPVEQVELLKKLYHNSFGFDIRNVNTVKNSILLSSSKKGSFYGKTGTGRIDGMDVNGWFIGYIEKSRNTYFFATNIKADKHATGSNAAKITLSILSDMNIWK